MCRLSLCRCGGGGCLSTLRLVGRLVEVLELLDDVLQAVHVVPQDDPVAQVAVGRVVLHVAELAGHDVALHVGELHDPLLGHGYLDLTQHLHAERERGAQSDNGTTNVEPGT